MKAMIFAAGKGTRMGTLTDTTPKPLLNLGNYSLIERQLYRLSSLKICECVINLRHLGDIIEKTLGNGEKYGLKIHYSREPEDLETGGGVVNALSIIGKSPFILLSGDILTDFPFDSLTLQTGKLAHIALVPNPPHHPEGDFYLQDNSLVSQHPEKAKNNKYTYGNIGIYHPDLFKPFPKGRRKLSEILRQGIADKKVTGELYTGQWLNVDTPGRLEVAREWCAREDSNL